MTASKGDAITWNVNRGVGGRSEGEDHGSESFNGGAIYTKRRKHPEIWSYAQERPSNKITLRAVFTERTRPSGRKERPLSSNKWTIYSPGSYRNRVDRSSLQCKAGLAGVRSPGESDSTFHTKPRWSKIWLWEAS